MNRFNLVVKRVKGREYLITDMMATKLTKGQFERLRSLNNELLGDYEYCDYKDTDFSWWSGVHKYLTSKRITTASFDIDYWGNVTKLN